MWYVPADLSTEHSPIDGAEPGTYRQSDGCTQPRTEHRANERTKSCSDDSAADDDRRAVVHAIPGTKCAADGAANEHTIGGAERGTIARSECRSDSSAVDSAERAADGSAEPCAFR